MRSREELLSSHASTPCGYANSALRLTFNRRSITSCTDLHPLKLFGIAYGDPDSIPLDGLLEAIGKGLKEDGRDLAKYPHPRVRQAG